MNNFLCLFSFFISFRVVSQIDFSPQTTSNEGNIILNYAKAALLSKAIQEGYYKGDISSLDRQSLCFVGDLIAILSSQNNTSIDSSLYRALNQYPTTYLNFGQVVELIKNQQVVMINEAHDRIKPRAFIYDMLPLFKKVGFTHLAMETINEDSKTDLTCKTGVYTSEPMMGLLYRRAIELGFNFITYDNLEKNRDSIQAINLWKAINDSTEIHKTLVISGYGHLEEWYNGKGIKSMGSYFKEISGIDPLTIDQIQMAEDSRSVVQRTFHRFFVDTISRFIDGSRFIIPPMCDIYICHPNTKFEHSRPIDILLEGERILKKIQVKNKQAVIIQLYLEKEIQTKTDFNTRIPTDQTTYIDSENNSYLSFSPNIKYLIVMRNSKNEVIGLKKKIVKK